MMNESAAAAVRPVLLIVDDDQELCSLLVEYLTPEGFAVELLANGAAALERLARSSPDLVVLDVMLPEISGFEVLRRIRATSGVPVIMLTARGEEVDRVVGLEMGADDYLAKPFSPRELVARIKAVLRRSAGDAGPVTSASSVQWGPLKIDLRARCAAVIPVRRSAISNRRIAEKVYLVLKHGRGAPGRNQRMRPGRWRLQRRGQRGNRSDIQ